MIHLEFSIMQFESTGKIYNDRIPKDLILLNFATFLGTI